VSHWDFKFHTSDRDFSGMGIVEADSEKEAKDEVAKEIKAYRPDVTIKEIVVEPTTMSEKEIKRIKGEA